MSTQRVRCLIEPERLQLPEWARDKDVLVLGPLGDYLRHRNLFGRVIEWDFEYLTGIARKVLGIDNNADLVRLAAQDGWNVVVGDAEQLSHVNERYDVIYAMDLIEHLGSPLSMLKGAAALLRPEGRLVVETPNVFSLPNLVKAALGLPVFKEPTHTSWIDIPHAAELGRRAGLALRQVILYSAVDRRKLSYRLRGWIYRKVSRWVPRFATKVVFVYGLDK